MSVIKYRQSPDYEQDPFLSLSLSRICRQVGTGTHGSYLASVSEMFVLVCSIYVTIYTVYMPRNVFMSVTK
uniref:Uncharacterized protein n=1 Tax=Anguilla anguilla TaxID=7936 RepID=A0A0E9XG32_ANGAN